MFQELFRRSRQIQQHLASPLLNERLQFLSHCAEHGAARRTLRNLASYQLILLDQLNLSGTRRITPTEIGAAAKRWAQHQTDVYRLKDAPLPRSTTHFVWHATQWLSFLGRLG